MTRIIHPNLLRAYAVIIPNNKAYIIMPLMLYGDLSSIIKFKYMKGIHDESAIATILKFCLDAIICLNENNWFHRDVKASNILLDKDGSLCLGDFGVSTIIKEEGNILLRGSKNRVLKYFYTIDFLISKSPDDVLKKCPNCGAELDKETGSRLICPYCRTLLVRKSPNLVMTRKHMERQL